MWSKWKKCHVKRLVSQQFCAASNLCHVRLWNVQSSQPNFRLELRQSVAADYDAPEHHCLWESSTFSMSIRALANVGFVRPNWFIAPKISNTLWPVIFGRSIPINDSKEFQKLNRLTHFKLCMQNSSSSTVNKNMVQAIFKLNQIVKIRLTLRNASVRFWPVWVGWWRFSCRKIHNLVATIWKTEGVPGS